MPRSHAVPLAAIPLLLVGCVTVIAPSAQPSPTPTSSPSPVSTPTASPSTGTDDQTIDALIRAGVAQAIQISTRVQNGDQLGGFRQLVAHAHTQLALVAIYRPSVCTAEAVGLYRDGMTALAKEAQVFVDWYEKGHVGAVPGDATMTDSGRLLGGAIRSLNTTNCGASSTPLSTADPKSIYRDAAQAFNVRYAALIESAGPDEPQFTAAEGRELAADARATVEKLRPLAIRFDTSRLTEALETLADLAESPVPPGMMPGSWSLLVTFSARDIRTNADTMRSQLGLPGRLDGEVL